MYTFTDDGRLVDDWATRFDPTRFIPLEERANTLILVDLIAGQEALPDEQD